MFHRDLNMLKDGFKKYTFIAIAFTVCSFNAKASNQSIWDHFSDYATYSLVASSIAIPSYGRDMESVKESAYTIGSAAAISLLGKSLISEERPDHSGNDSFPSNHTSVAFASATNLYIKYGWQAGLPAYGLSSLVAIGRVESEKHHWKDVVAGAAIGSLSAYFFTTPLNDSISLVPWVDREQAGLSLSMRW